LNPVLTPSLAWMSNCAKWMWILTLLKKAFSRLSGNSLLIGIVVREAVQGDLHLDGGYPVLPYRRQAAQGGQEPSVPTPLTQAKQVLARRLLPKCPTGAQQQPTDDHRQDNREIRPGRRRSPTPFLHAMGQGRCAGRRE
jgi:hypothetical protein